MAEAYLQLSAEDRQEALRVAADRSGRPVHLLEKDVWVVSALETLFRSSIGEHLVFKGGTSLSKAFGVIRRFSEDVELTFDIRQLLPDLVGGKHDALPKTRSEEKRWPSEVRKRLPAWVSGTVEPILAQALTSESLAAAIRSDGDKLFLAYQATCAGSGYVGPSVMLEFGARSSGEPATECEVKCDADGLVDGVLFPFARPRVMRAERTFWEKATAIHVFCLQQRLRGDRFARHWHDLVRLDDAGLATAAFADRDLAHAVARHKTMFFPEKAADRSVIDYDAAVNGGLQLVPMGKGRTALAEDYDRMVEDGLLLEDAEPFEVLMARCTDIAERSVIAHQAERER